MIEVNPKIMLGKPVLKGTRVTIELVLHKLTEGMTPEDIVKAYPTISVQDVLEVMKSKK